MNFIIFASAVEYNLLQIFYLRSKQNLFIFDKFSNSISEKYYFLFLFSHLESVSVMLILKHPIYLHG